jgi:selenocysteine lyase/cysteine desulfurase
MISSGRRAFFQKFVGGLAVAAALPPIATQRHWLVGAQIPRLRGLPDYGVPDEGYWDLVAQQFSLRPGLIMMNAANLCPAPYPVAQSVNRLTADVDADASFQNRAKFGPLREAARQGLAAYMGADPDEIAITRNTSEGNNTVVNGLELGPGDEVVIWDQNHPTNNVSWDVRADRYRFRVRRVATPPFPGSEAELVEPLLQAVTRDTRVLAFSHVSNVSGVAMPAQRICDFARERGIFTLVDGAQTFGALRLDLHRMGCDAFTGSSHKWFVGPKEAGVLYVRRDRVAEIWPGDVGVGWEAAVGNGAQKFENLGQRDDAAVAAMGTAVTFHETIGIDAAETRVRQLATALKQGLSAAIPDIAFRTPLDPQLSAGVVVFLPRQADARQLFERLYADHNIAGAAMGGGFTGVRLSPHIYNTMAEIERVIEVVASLA